VAMIEPSDGSKIPENEKITPEQHEKMAEALAKAIGGPVKKGGNGGRGGFRYTF